MVISFTTKINQRPAGQELSIVNEVHNVSLVLPYRVKLIEVPLFVSPSTVLIPGYVETFNPAPSPGRFFTDYNTGYLTFHSSAAGDPVSVSYQGRGSIVDAVDVNSLQSILGVSFNPDGTLGSYVVKPINISITPTDIFTFPNLQVPTSAVDPISPTPGMVWYNTLTDCFVGQKVSGPVILG